MSTPGEIIVIHMGQGGNRLGARFWEAIADEHGIELTGSGYGDKDQQLKYTNVFFKTSTDGRFFPRAILADLESGNVEAVGAGPCGKLFKSDNFVFGQIGSENNWAKGYTEGAGLIDAVLDVIRQEAEECTNLQGFILIHSIGGGTGSGMGSLLLYKLREEYREKVITTFSIFPSLKLSDTVVEPYNAVLSIKALTDLADLVFCLDNEAFYDVLVRQLKVNNPTYEDINSIAAAALSDITASLRFPAKGENCLSSLQAMVDQLIPSKEVDFQTEDENSTSKSPLHFLSVALAPMDFGKGKSVINANSIKSLFDAKHSLTSGTPEKGKYLSVVGIFRGAETQPLAQAFHAEIAEIQETAGNSDTVMKTGSIELLIPRKNSKAGAALIANNTFAQTMLQRIADEFTRLFRRKSYLQWYTGEGLDEMEFTEAESNLSDLITMYQNKQENIESI